MGCCSKKKVELGVGIMSLKEWEMKVKRRKTRVWTTPLALTLKLNDTPNYTILESSCRVANCWFGVILLEWLQTNFHA